MKHLYFKHSNGTYSLVHTDVETESYAWVLIFEDLRKRNYEFVPTKQYTYYDVWNRQWFDVGANNESYVIF